MIHPPPTIATRAALPLRVFVVVLVLVFGVEMGIMLTLPWWNPWPVGDLELAVVDALVLTAVLSPAVWFVVVRPLRDLFEQRGRLLERVFEVQEEERARIARDLHDELGQLLTATLVGLRTVEQAADLPTARARAAALCEVAAGGLDSVRRLAHGLRASVLEDLGPRPAVERLCEDAAAASGVDFDVSVEFPTTARLEPAVEVAVYRLVQEGVTNIARHADARHASVRLRLEAEMLEIEIRDDGRGIAPGDAGRSEEGLGLQGMRERVAFLGGRIRVETSPATGTAILIGIPGIKVLHEPHQSPDR